MVHLDKLFGSFNADEVQSKSSGSNTSLSEKVEVKLVNGTNHCSGRVELLHNGQWGTICDDGWNVEEASVVCRQLDCGAPKSAPGRAKFGRGTGPIWLADVKCSGTELDLGQCPASPWGENDCSHREDAGVVCSGRFVALPLIHMVVST